jgi:hypothetical protein
MGCTIQLCFDRAKRVEGLVKRFLFGMLVLLAVSTFVGERRNDFDQSRTVACRYNSTGPITKIGGLSHD